MRNLIISCVLAITLITSTLTAQNCVFYYPEKVGNELVYKNYDKHNKLVSTVTQKVVDYHATSKGAEATIHVKSVTEKGNKEYESELHVKCEAGIFYFDMSEYFNQQALAGFKNMQMKMQTDNLEMPSKVSPGDKLKDGKITLELFKDDTKIMTMEILVTDRLVEPKEKITTEAGTFDCIKISQTITTKMPIVIKTKGTQWLKPGIGIIKNETFSENGNLMGTMVLTQISQ